MQYTPPLFIWKVEHPVPTAHPDQCPKNGDFLNKAPGPPPGPEGGRTTPRRNAES
jgi:hypothetical protein